MQTSTYAQLVHLPEEPPKQFRIFRAGLNETSKGPLIFDEESEASVLALFEREGVDVMIDFNHDAIDPEMLRARKDAADAMGWCRLAVMNHELWAVDVRWTPEGDERIRSKKQRYISPAVMHDDDGHVEGICNIALVAMPATHGAQPLIAASKVKRPAPAWKEKFQAVRLAYYSRGVARPSRSAINQVIRSRAAAKK